MAHRSLAAVLLASLFLAACSVEAYNTNPLLNGMSLTSRCCLKSAANHRVPSYIDS